MEAKAAGGGDRSPSRLNTATLLLGALTLAVTGRCVQLAVRPALSDAAPSAAVVIETAESLPQTGAVDADLALLAQACPHAAPMIAEWSSQGSATPGGFRRTALHTGAQENDAPTGRITAIRVAMRDAPLRVAQRQGDWLVAPEAWRVPEDSDAEVPQAAETDVPADEAPAEAAPAESGVELPPAEPLEPARPLEPRPSPFDAPAIGLTTQPANQNSAVPSGETSDIRPAPQPRLEADGIELPDAETAPPAPIKVKPSRGPIAEPPSTPWSPPAQQSSPGNEPSTEKQADPPKLEPLPEPSRAQAPVPPVTQEAPPQAPALKPEVPPTPKAPKPVVEDRPKPVVEDLPKPVAKPKPPEPSPPLSEAPERAPSPPQVEAPQLVAPPVAAPPVAEPPVAGPAVAGPAAPEVPFLAPGGAPSVPNGSGPGMFAPPGFGAPPLPAANPPAAASSPHSAAASAKTAAVDPNDPYGERAHRELYAKNCYPSAADCAKCHPKHYDEWRVSSHAYAFVSPMYQKFEQKIYDLSNGTIGYFCQRCHAPVATAMCESRDTPIWEQARAAREGITCIACHRVNERYARTNGERRIVPGDSYAPVYCGKGGQQGAGIAEVIAKKGDYKVKTSDAEKGPGQAIHLEGRFFDQISYAEFCTSCHQVAVHPGVKLEVVWEQYRASPACAKGITCQDCHMGKVPGQPCGYENCSIAEIGGKKLPEDRRHANHIFHGPGYSIAHPGVFPMSEAGDKWTIEEWLAFDWRAGWGTDDFEDAVEDGRITATFPKPWDNSDTRMDAREVIEDNLEALGVKRKNRQQVMSDSLRVEGPIFDSHPVRCQDLNLRYVVTNMNEGHNVLTASLGAQPQLWANVVLIGPNGERLWETGYTDSSGDLANLHSADVRAGLVPYDSQLFNLQTMFLITGATGTDREFPLPVNLDFDQIGFLRPGAIPVTVTNHPPFIRMESRSIAPLGSRNVPYRIPAAALTQPGRYRLSFRMRNRVEPIYFMRFCDATPEMERSMNENILDIHPYSVEFEVR